MRPADEPPALGEGVRCELTSVRTSGTDPGSRNAEASVPEFPSPTPSGFAAKSRSPASQIFGRFRIEPSSARRGASHHRGRPTASETTANLPSHTKTRPLESTLWSLNLIRLPLLNAHHAAPSRAATRSPVRDCVRSSAANSPTARPRPTHAACRRPRHSGSSAQASAAAWFGL